LIMQIMDKVPATGEKIQLEGWELEVVDMDGRRVDKVLATHRAQEVDEYEDG
jgi:putative hemolysin